MRRVHQNCKSCFWQVERVTSCQRSGASPSRAAISTAPAASVDTATTSVSSGSLRSNQTFLFYKIKLSLSQALWWRITDRIVLSGRVQEKKYLSKIVMEAEPIWSRNRGFWRRGKCYWNRRGIFEKKNFASASPIDFDPEPRRFWQKIEYVLTFHLLEHRKTAIFSGSGSYVNSKRRTWIRKLLSD